MTFYFGSNDWIKVDEIRGPLTKAKRKVIYRGNKYLGEYQFNEAVTYRAFLNDSTPIESIGIVDIYFESLFGYHLMNSFTPSTLMILITYASLFFPLVNFNERVMVSLTALLVLAAFFIQFSHHSVKTSYFKLIDVWYVIMIFFGFIVVIFNIIVHKISFHDATQLESNFNKEDELLREEEIRIRKVENINSTMKIGISIIYSLFVLLYVFTAAHIIPI